MTKKVAAAVLRPNQLAIAVASAFFSAGVAAQTASGTLPSGGQVTSGSATLTYSPNKLQIDQGSNKAILQWDGFSIGSSAWVNFSQPSASAVALNRVTGTNPSEIFGRLTANGQVFLSNPNGVLFAPGASVDVGGLFATTLAIADRDFLAGRYNFYNAGGAGSVVNQGVITATGYAALAAPQVKNDGIIIARAGTVAIAAGDRVSLDMVGDGLIKVSVDQAALNASAINSGRIEADGGNVVLTARSANALLDTVVNNTGIIRANSLVERNGEIVLDGGSAGVVANSGTLQAAGLAAGTTGGVIRVFGDRIGVAGVVDASGDAGGGSITVGTPSSTATFIAAGATIRADATGEGAGGLVETSGRYLEVNSAPQIGAGGTWLIDPFNIEIVAGNGTSNNNGATTFTPNGDNSQIGAQLIVDQLNAGTNVTVDTGAAGSAGTQAGDILVNAAIEKTGANAASLALKAFHDVRVSQPITISSSGFGPSGPGTLKIDAGNDVVVGAPINTPGGGLSITAGTFTNLSSINNGVGGGLQSGMAIFADGFNLSRGTVDGGLGSVGLFARSAGKSVGIESSGDVQITNADLASITTAADSPLTNANQLLIGATANMTIGQIARVEGGAKNLILTASGGPGTGVTVGPNGVSTTGDLRIDAGLGSLTGAGTIAGNRVILNANQGIGAAGARVNTAASTLAARANNGSVFVGEADAVVLGNVTLAGQTATSGTGPGGTFDLSAGGAVTVAGSVNAGGAMSVNAGGLLKVASTPTIAASLTSTGGQTLTATSLEVTATGAAATVLNNGGNQTITINGGGTGAGIDVKTVAPSGTALIQNNGSGTQTVTVNAADHINLDAAFNNAAIIGNGTQNVSITGTAAPGSGRISLQNSAVNFVNSFAGIQAPVQTISASGDVTLKANFATGTSQGVRIGGIGGVPGSDTNLTLTSTNGSVVLTGGTGAGNGASIGSTVASVHPSTITINATNGQVIMNSGADAGARIGYAQGLPAGGDITINAGGLQMNGTANPTSIRTQGNVTLNLGSGSATQGSNGVINANTLTVKAGSASLTGPNAVSTITAPQSGAVPGIAGDFNLNNGGALAVTDLRASGTVTITNAGTITLNASGTQDARISSIGGQSITADGLILRAQDGRVANITNASGNQSIVTGVGGVELSVAATGQGVAQIVNARGATTNGTQTVQTSGALNVVGGSTTTGGVNSGIFQLQTGKQTVTAASISLAAATAAVNNGGALITNTGNNNLINVADQEINVNAGGITLTGGAVGLTNRAGISTNGNQTINGNPDILITGGSSGSGTGGNSNSAFIAGGGSGKVQTINAGNITLKAGPGGTDTAATITGAKQVITASGDVRVTGSDGNSGDSNGARIGGLAGNAPTATDLTLTARDVILTAGVGAASGAALGSSNNATTPPDNNITVKARDVTLNASNTNGVRIGTNSEFATPAAGNISVMASRDIALNGTTVQAAAIRTIGNVTLQADHDLTSTTNGYVTGGGNLAVKSTTGKTSLIGPNNVSSLSGSSGGTLSFVNAAPLVVNGRLSSLGAMDLTVAGRLSVLGSAGTPALIDSAAGQTITANSIELHSNGAGATIRNAGGNTVLNADSFSLADGAVIGGTGAVILRPRTAGNSFGIEAAGATTLTNADIASISTSDYIVFGSGNAATFNGALAIGANAQVEGHGNNLAFFRGTTAAGTTTVGPFGVATTGNLIVSGGGGSLNGTGILAGNKVQLRASSGIGSAGARVNTSAQSLTISTGGAGAFVNAVGPVTLADGNQLVGGTPNTMSNSTSGVLDLTATGTVTVAGPVTAGASMNIDAAGTLKVASTPIASASLTSTGGQKLTASSLEVTANGGGATILNNGGNQTITIDGGGTGAGIDVKTLAPGGAAVIQNNGGGTQTITVNAADHINLDAGFTNASILATGGPQNISITGNGAPGSGRISVQNSAVGFTNSFAGFNAPQQNITASGDITLTARSAIGTAQGVRIGGLAGVPGSDTNLTLTTTNGNVMLTGGSGAGNGAAIGSTVASVHPSTITINATNGQVILNSGADGGARIGYASGLPAAGDITINAAGVQLNGTSQPTAIRTQGTVNLSVFGGNVTEASNGSIIAGTLNLNAQNASLGGPNQIGTLSAQTLGDFSLVNSGPLVVNSINAGTSSLTNSGPVTVSGLWMGGPTTLNVSDLLDVRNGMVQTSGNQTINAGSLSVTASGPGIASISQVGSGAQSITVTGGSIDVQAVDGGVLASINADSVQNVSLVNGDHISANGMSGLATIGTFSGTQTISASGSGRNAITVGSAGAFGPSSLVATGNQTITAGSLSVTSGSGSASIGQSGAGNQSISVTGGSIDVQAIATGSASINAQSVQNVILVNGDHINVNGALGLATINSALGTQAVSATGTGRNAITVGSTDALGGSSIVGFKQSVTAGNLGETGSITIVGSGTQGAPAWLLTTQGAAGTQTVSTSGRLTVLGGSAASQAANVTAAVLHNGGGAQTINARGITLAAGNTGNGNGAFINSTGGGIPANAGNQVLNLNGGDVTIMAGAAGTGNRAGIIASANQTINGAGAITVTGGAGGGGSAVNNTSNGAFISANTPGRLQTIKDAGSITLNAGTGGIDTFSVISGASQAISVTGDVRINGGTGTGVANGARLGGPTGGATNLTLGAHDVVLHGDLTGAGIGSAVLGTAQANNITIGTTGDIVLEAGSGAGVRIGSSAINGMAGGNIHINAASLALKGTTTQAASIRTLGDVTLNTGGSITETFNGFILANNLTANAGGSMALAGPNQLSAFNGTTGGDLMVFNTGALNVAGVSATGDATLDNTGNVTLSGPWTAGGTTSIAVHSDLVLRDRLTSHDVLLAATTGSIREEGAGAISAGTFTTSSAGDTLLGGANQVGRFTASAGGDVLLTNASPMLSLGAMDLPGALTVNQTGLLSLPNSISSLAQSYSATGDITVGDAAATAPTVLGAFGAMGITSGGSVLLRGSDTSPGISAIVSGGTVNLSSAGDLRLIGGAAAGSQALVLGGTAIDLHVGGVLALDGTSDTGAWARVQTATTSGTINVYFPTASSGGYLVDGFQRLKHGEDGFYTGDKPAKSGTSLFLHYGP